MCTSKSQIVIQFNDAELRQGLSPSQNPVELGWMGVNLIDSIHLDSLFRTLIIEIHLMLISIVFELITFLPICWIRLNANEAMWISTDTTSNPVSYATIHYNTGGTSPRSETIRTRPGFWYGNYSKSGGEEVSMSEHGVQVDPRTCKPSIRPACHFFASFDRCLYVWSGC